MTSSPTPATASPATTGPHIVFLLFDGITQLDFTGPAQFLSRMPGARVSTTARERRAIATDSGFALLPTCDFTDCDPADILCVPGGYGVTDALGCAQTRAFIATQAQSARWVTSVCTGAFLLGAAGLLAGRRATTHWAYTHLLPLVGAQPTPDRVVEDGRIITAGGVTSGIDFALTLIARDAGEGVARSVQLALEYDPAPPFTGGTPASAPAATLDLLKTHIYDAAAQRMHDALIAHPRRD
jgi:cyclohexyl-isocyanide hydratase